MRLPPVLPRPSRRPASAVERAARLASVWGWSYIITLGALLALWEVPSGTVLFDWVLQTSLLFTLIGVTELIWRAKLLATRQAKWVRVLAANELAGTLALVWSIAWLGRVPVAELVDLLTPQTRKILAQFMALTGQPLTDETILQAFANAKVLTMYGAGGVLFLSQIWVIYRYLALHRPIAQEAKLPPLLSHG